MHAGLLLMTTECHAEDLRRWIFLNEWFLGWLCQTLWFQYLLCCLVGTDAAVDVQVSSFAVVLLSWRNRYLQLYLLCTALFSGSCHVCHIWLGWRMQAQCHSLQSLHDNAMQLHKREHLLSLFVGLLGSGRQPCWFDCLFCQVDVLISFGTTCSCSLWGVPLHTTGWCCLIWFVQYHWNTEGHQWRQWQLDATRHNVQDSQGARMSSSSRFYCKGF